MSGPHSDILFLCVANSARSQLAEGLARRLAPRGVGIHSAGSAPGSLNPHVVRVLAEREIDIRGHRSKGIDEVPVERVGVVVTLCAEEVCPVLPGDVERHHWPLPDPAAVSGTEAEILRSFRDCRDEIEQRLAAFFASRAIGGGDATSR
jgi:arsenate reductase